MENGIKVGTSSANITEVILVLGKRLVDSQLTEESLSRVTTLVQELKTRTSSSYVLIFCGGRLEGQLISEAEAMFQAFVTQWPEWANYLPQTQVLIESRSTTTVENIANASSELIKSGLCQSRQHVNVRMCSNDYHIQRIFDIERLMPEQGLLNRLTERARQAGLFLTVPLDVSQHITVPYPYQTQDGEAFLLIEKLTYYRIYLEGLESGVFNRSLEQVRTEPMRITLDALQQLKAHPLLRQELPVLERFEQIIQQTDASANYADGALLNEYNQRLLDLNRRFDPEGQKVSA